MQAQKRVNGCSMLFHPIKKSWHGDASLPQVRRSAKFNGALKPAGGWSLVASTPVSPECYAHEALYNRIS
jgi:hypothetical protein